MKVHELIKKLSKLNQNAEVFVDGYEGGITELNEVYVTGIARNQNTGWYNGKHETSEDSSEVIVYLPR